MHPLARPKEAVRSDGSEKDSWNELVVEVGKPVARCPPHRSRRAVFPHRALQINSLSHAPDERCGEGVYPPSVDKSSSLSGKASLSLSFPQCAAAAPGSAGALVSALPN